MALGGKEGGVWRRVPRGWRAGVLACWRSQGPSRVFTIHGLLRHCDTGSSPEHSQGMNPISALMNLDGAARRETLLAAGVTRNALGQAVGSGAIVRFYRGCYALPGASAAARSAAMFRGVPTCVTALRAWGIPAIDAGDAIHVEVPKSRGLRSNDRRPHRDVVLHRVTKMAVGIPAVDCVEVLAQAYRCLGEYAFIAAVDAACHHGLLAPWELDRLERRIQVSRGSLARRVDGRSESPGETYARLALVAAGFEVELQVRFARDLRVDLVVEGKVVIEVDGRAHHASPEDFRRDHERDRRLALLDLPVARFTVAEILLSPDVVPRHVAKVLGASASIKPSSTRHS